MPASLLKLLTIGVQNERLIFKKTLYPFIKIWYSTGRFTTQWVRLDFDYNPQFGQTASFRITRKGQLCTRLYLVATFPNILSPQAAAAAAATPPSAFAGPRLPLRPPPRQSHLRILTGVASEGSAHNPSNTPPTEHSYHCNL